MNGARINGPAGSNASWHYANGKIILFGEHAVVYGVEAVAAAIPDMVRARVSELPPNQNATCRIKIANWGVDTAQENDRHTLLTCMYRLIVEELGLSEIALGIEIDARVPPASGLGASAAVAVAMTKAIAHYKNKDLGSSQINDIAFKCEKLAHGTPSGLDNTLATYGGVMRFKRVDEQFEFSVIPVAEPIELLVALSGKKGFTAETVARVRDAKRAQPEYYQAIFDDIADISQKGIAALAAGQLHLISELMKQNQSSLRLLGVSCKEIEQVLTLAANHEETAGKLTGSGDGGAVLLLPGQAIDVVEQSLHSSGFSTLRACIQ